MTQCVAQGVNMTALREIKLLKELDSPYIVRLLDVFPHKRNLSLVRSASASSQSFFFAIIISSYPGSLCSLLAQALFHEGELSPAPIFMP